MQVLEACPRLAEIYESQSTIAADGSRLPIHSQLHPDTADALHRQVKAAKPAVCLEIGMAYGASTLAILSALPPGGRLISIDPNQSSQWQGAGLESVRRAGYSSRHELIEDFDYLALPRLLASGLVLDFAFIDGWHTFDYTVLDFWYVDRMLKVGGIAVLDDTRRQQVYRAINFFLTHRQYEEFDAGLPDPRKQGSRVTTLVRSLFGSRAVEALRRLRGHPEAHYCPDNRYFRKTGSWEPDWDFWTPF